MSERGLVVLHADVSKFEVEEGCEERQPVSAMCYDDMRWMNSIHHWIPSLQSFSLGVYEVPNYYMPDPGALDITQADALQRGLLIQLLPQVLAMRTFPKLPCEQLTKGFFDAPDPMHEVAICFIKVHWVLIRKEK